jgi:predicted nucleic acid-binding protein
MIRALDANIIVDLLHGKDAALAACYLEGRPADHVVPEMVRAELLLGANLSSRASENRKAVGKVLAPLRLLTLHTMVVENRKLSDPASPGDERNASRLDLLKKSINDLQTTCASNAKSAGDQQRAVDDFLDYCAVVLRSN